MTINDLVTRYVSFCRALGERCRTKDFVLRSFCRAVGPRTWIGRILKLPEVCGGLDTASVDIGVGSTYAHADKLALRLSCDKLLESISQSIDIGFIVVEIAELVGRDFAFSNNITILVNEAKSCVGTADVDTHRIFFHHSAKVFEI